MGPGGRSVRVQRAITHPAQQRVLVSIQTEDGGYPFTVTADHEIVIKGAGGRHQEIDAREFVNRGAHSRPLIFDGHFFQQVVQAWEVQQVTEVVEATFDEDATVLAWLLPERRSSKGKARSLLPSSAVTCRGAPPVSWDGARQCGAVVRNTFFDDGRFGDASSLRRCRSVGDLPGINVGSLRHSDVQPDQCAVCLVHHRHLLDPSKPKCRLGHECMRCHMPHRELPRGTRRTNLGQASSQGAAKRQS